MAPRIWICMPPPGTPLFSKTVAPTTLPASWPSTDLAGAMFSSSAETEAMAVEALRRSTVVAWPVTVTPSSWRTSLSSAKSAEIADAPTARLARLKPMARTSTVAPLAGIFSRYSPRSLVRTPTCAPRSPTVASVMGFPEPACVTLPVISRVCAARVAGMEETARASNSSIRRRTLAPRGGRRTNERLRVSGAGRDTQQHGPANTGARHMNRKRHVTTMLQHPTLFGNAPPLFREQWTISVSTPRPCHTSFRRRCRSTGGGWSRRRRTPPPRESRRAREAAARRARAARSRPP